jgi:hypothetical protein
LSTEKIGDTFNNLDTLAIISSEAATQSPSTFDASNI